MWKSGISQNKVFNFIKASSKFVISEINVAFYSVLNPVFKIQFKIWFLTFYQDPH